MFGVNGGEFVVLVVIALVVIGPERLPAYAEQLGAWVRTLRRFMSTAKERVATELGEEAADVDWASLDPRRYDPRRIVREALLDDLGPAPSRMGPAAAAGTAGVASASGAARAEARDGSTDVPPAPVPFDDEAT